MNNYKFTYEDKNYELSENNFDYLINDEENPVEGIDEGIILDLLNGKEQVEFDVQYYDKACESCKAGKGEEEAFKFLEYHFYIFTKNGKYIMSNISKEFENTSFTRLMSGRIVDNSYVVSIMVCKNCGRYAVEIEQCDM